LLLLNFYSLSIHGRRKDLSRGRLSADFPQVAIKIFQGVAKSSEISFFLLETKKKRPFLLKM